MLVLASVLGREFALAALARLAGVSEDELLDLLDEALTARVVSDVPGGPGRLRFAHALIRDTLYEGLTTARRVRLHRLAVEALEALYGDEPGPHLAELAYHSIAGGDLDKGVGYARRAGDRALALLAYEEAARLYGMALDAHDLAQPLTSRRAASSWSRWARRRVGREHAGREGSLPRRRRHRSTPRPAARACPRRGRLRRSVVMGAGRGRRSARAAARGGACRARRG